MTAEMATTITNGFLIVEPYDSLYRKYVGRYNLTADVYAIPRTDKDGTLFLEHSSFWSTALSGALPQAKPLRTFQ